MKTITAASTIALALPLEEDVLTAFWEKCSAGGDRMELVKELSTVHVQRPPEWSKQTVRAAFVPPGPWPMTGCFTCYRRDRWLAWHHVIAIDHGGSNSVRNLTTLCHVCHQRVHPWMEPAPYDAGMRMTALETLVERLLTPGAFTAPPARRQVYDDEGHYSITRTPEGEV